MATSSSAFTESEGVLSGKKIQVAENSFCQQVGGGEISLEQKENNTYPVTVGLNQGVRDSYLKNIYWVHIAVQSFGEVQALGGMQKCMLR